MIKLLIISDDFTGALDTGVSFAACGVSTRVVTNTYYDFSDGADEVCTVLVLDAETRHLDQKEAYRIVFRITRSAYNAGIPYIYKKTDSALRGNIGSEMTAMMEGAKADKMVFIPAYPKMGRITEDGIHYIEGKPVAESIFGLDAFEPVKFSDVSQIIASQSDVPIVHHAVPEGINSVGINFYDVDTDEKMWDVARCIGIEGLHLMAGCAGFASVLPEMLGLMGNKPRSPQFIPKLLVICGSTNPITQKQLVYAEKAGFLRIRLAPTQKLDPFWLSTIDCTQSVSQWSKLIKQNSCSIVDVGDFEGSQDTMNYAALSGLDNEKIRTTITETLGQLSKKFLDSGLDATLMIIGGDTMLGVMQAFDVSELSPFYEMAPGVALSQFTYKSKQYNVISKSGSFGTPDLLTEIVKQIGAEPDRKDTK